MNVVHYILGMPPVRKGGLPKYALSLINSQKQMGHNIKIIIPGPFDRSCQTKIKSWKKFNDVQSYRIINGLPVSNEFGIKEIVVFTRPLPEEVFEEWMEQNQVELLHIHSMMGLPLELVRAAKKKSVKVIMTTHDFFGICPKVDLMRGEEFCGEGAWQNCEECCRDAYSVKRLQLMHSDLYWWYCSSDWLFNSIPRGLLAKIKKIWRYFKKANVAIATKKAERINYEPLKAYYRTIFSCVDYFHFNSGQTEEVFRGQLGEIPGEVIDIVNDGVHDNRVARKCGDVLQLGYIGGKVRHKGFYFMADRLQKIYDEGRKGFVCHTFMLEDTREYSFIENHGPYKYEEQKEIFGLMDVLIVPSIWRETYGMVVLEAISNGVPVILSEYVGAKSLVERYPGIGKVFSVQGEDFLHLVEEIYDDRDKLEQMNQEILKMDYDFDMGLHANRIEDLYHRVLARSE